MYNPADGDFNSMFATTNADGMAVGEQDMTKRVSDFFQFGIVDALTSGAVGVYNSVKGVANSFGAELPMTSVQDTIRAGFGQQSVDYYNEHKVQADAAGFVVTSLAAGFGAIKGVRMLQSGGIASLGFKAATGFAGTDLVLGSAEAAAYRAAVVSNPATYSWTNAKFLSAVGWATRQNVTEALASEALFMLTHNQSPLLNPDGLSAWESSKDMFTSGLPLLGAFTAGSVLMDAVRLRGSARAAFKLTEAGNLGRMQTIGAELGDSYTTSTAGDRLLAVGKASDTLQSPEYAVGSMEELRKSFGPEYTQDQIANVVAVRTQKAAAQLKTVEGQIIVDANKAGNTGLEALTQMRQHPDPTARVNLLGNLRSVSYINEAESTALANQIRTLVPARTGTVAADAEPLARLTDLTRTRLITSSAAMRMLAGEFTLGKNSRVFADLASYAAKHDEELAATLAKSRKDAAEFAAMLWAAPESVRTTMRAANVAKHEELLGATPAQALKNVQAQYAADVVDGIVRAASRLQHDVEAGALLKDYPALAEYMRKAGAGLAQRAPRAYYNVRTKQPVVYMMPRANDTHLVTYTKNGIEAVLHGSLDARTVLPYTVDAAHYPAVLKRMLESGEDTISPDFVTSAHFAAAASRPLTVVNNQVLLHATDLPMLERAATAEGMQAGITFVVSKNAGLGGQAMSQQELRSYVIAQKQEALLAYQAARLNEQQIAVLLNSGLDFARGMGTEDALLMGKLDYSRPETVRMNYNSYNTKRVDMAARTYEGVQARLDASYALRQQAASKVLGASGARMPEENIDLLQRALSQTDQKASLFSQQLSDFGSFREWASNVGAMVHGIIDTSRQAVENSYKSLYQKLTMAGAVSERAQLSLINNLARRERYRVVATEDGKFFVSAAAYEEDLQTVARRIMQQDTTLAPDAAVSLARVELETSGHWAERVGMRDGTAVKLMPAVEEAVGVHMSHNAEIIARDRMLAEAEGRTINRDANFYYPPPLNLRRTPFFSFVVPTEANADLPSFMIYGATSAELDLKRAYVNQHYGPRYKVVNNDDVKLHKQLQGQYDKGEVFDAWDFDSNLQRTGSATDLQPSLDLHATEALDLMRNWTHRKYERQIKQAVSLKYARTVQALKMADLEYDASARSSLETTRSTARTVFGDTLKMMLYSDSATGTAVTGYRRINDWIGENGSRVLDATVGAMGAVWDGAKAIAGKKGTHAFDDQALQDLTAKLEASGLTNPYDNLVTALARSKVISDGRSLMQATRVLNTLVAGSTLRLDFWNSIVSVLSVPVLMSSIVREAKQALAGTENGKRLAALTTVRNPGTGLVEPTAAKLMIGAVKAIFSAEGKEFAAELRKRYILDDPTRIYLEAQDFSSLNGRHTLRDVQQKIDDFMKIAQKPFMHRLAEDMSRLLVAHAFKQVAELRGYKGEEMYSVIRNAVDRVHGIHRAHGRFQLFNGVVGQSLGLFQTYMWNVAQQMLRHVENGKSAELLKAAFMQSTLFGVRSLPSFHTMNQLVADTNSGKLDAYSLAGTDDDPQGYGKYIMYGALTGLLPADLFSRGEFALRNNTVVPINPADWPAISVVSKAVGNVVNTLGMAKQALADGTSMANVVGYGLAHNALNRPLAAWAQLATGTVTTGDGTPLFVNVNRENFDPVGQFNLAAIGARLLGSKPATEAILLDSYYRRVGYQSEQRSEMNKLGERMRISLQGGADVTDEQLAGFVAEYEASGGGIENFHAYFARQLGAASQSSVDSFRQKLSVNSAMSRAYGRLAADRSMEAAWKQDYALAAQQEEQAGDGQAAGQ